MSNNIKIRVYFELKHKLINTRTQKFKKNPGDIGIHFCENHLIKRDDVIWLPPTNSNFLHKFIHETGANSL